MKKKLSIVQIICILISGLLPLWDKMLIWDVINFPSHEHYSTIDKSLFNLMTVQIGGICSFLFWAFDITLLAMIVYNFSELFLEEKLKNRKAVAKAAIVVPVLSLLDGLLMIIIANNHYDIFFWKGQERHVSVSATVVAYIELVFLFIIPLIECYKQFKCVNQPKQITSTIVNLKSPQSDIDEIKKYKELLDMGAITQEEFEAKKKQLLGL